MWKVDFIECIDGTSRSGLSSSDYGNLKTLLDDILTEVIRDLNP